MPACWAVLTRLSSTVARRTPTDCCQKLPLAWSQRRVIPSKEWPSKQIGGSFEVETTIGCKTRETFLHNFELFLMKFALELNMPFSKFTLAPLIKVDHSFRHYGHFVSGQHCAGGRGGGGCYTWDRNIRKIRQKRSSQCLISFATDCRLTVVCNLYYLSLSISTEKCPVTLLLKYNAKIVHLLVRSHYGTMWNVNGKNCFTSVLDISVQSWEHNSVGGSGLG